jgi:hypothetical protein
MRKKLTYIVLSSVILAGVAVSRAEKAEKIPAKKPAADGTLYDAATATGMELKSSGCRTEVVDFQEGKALKMVFGIYENWPKLIFSGPWDLTGYSGIEARITNIGTVNEKIFLQASNPGEPSVKAWNMAVAYNGVAPGETVTLRIDFGYNNFMTREKAYPLDPSKITSILLGVSHPKEQLTFRLESLRAVK